MLCAFDSCLCQHRDSIDACVVCVAPAKATVSDDDSSSSEQEAEAAPIKQVGQAKSVAMSAKQKAHYITDHGSLYSKTVASFHAR